MSARFDYCSDDPRSTDSQFCWKPAQHTFSCLHGYSEDMREIPTVDERIQAPALANVIKLHATIILDGEPDYVLRQITMVKRVLTASESRELHINRRLHMWMQAVLVVVRSRVHVADLITRAGVRKNKGLIT